MELNNNGRFFTLLKNNIKFGEAEINAMNETVSQLLTHATNENKPGMLLGKIQSGKTRSFMGSMALGFDNGYEVVVILTKNSNALVKQTYERIEKEFAEVIDEDEMIVYDIMNIPENLRKFELDKKIVIVAKKEKKNMERLERLLFTLYPTLSERKLLFIDDEADFASVVYENDRAKNSVDLKVIAKCIDDIRSKLTSASYLQVTATPYSLYLQPDDEIVKARGYQPNRPAFTVLVPIHDKYIGGDYYFEKSKEEGHIASYLYQEISDIELDILKKADNRKMKPDHLLTSDRYKGIREALVNFIVGGKIRNLQQQHAGQRKQKYAFIMHTVTSKQGHEWQTSILQLVEERLIASIDEEPALFNKIIETSYKSFEKSKGDTLYFPTYNEVLTEVRKALSDQELLISIVNSEQDVNALLDKSGQLKLRAPLNMFIGGQILDRGITIGNLIGFYYGRNPQKFQQDTVLQHSRMYGARPIEDLSVTRFYTTKLIYDVMERMHHFDNDLRKAFESGANEKEVVFVLKDDKNQIQPCSPNKILLSKVVTVKPGKRFLPVGFQTLAKTELGRKMVKIDKMIESLKENAIQVDPKDNRNILVPLEKVKTLISLIHETLVMEEGYEWDLESYLSVLNYLSKVNTAETESNIWMILRHNKDIRRKRIDNDRFIDSPDTGTDEGKVAKGLAQEVPALILVEQQGKEEKGWRGGRFYWPVIIAQKEIQTTVFSK